MSEVEVLNYLKKILGKYERIVGIKTFFGDNKVVCTAPNNCITIYNPTIELTWDANGYLTEIKISGNDQNGNTRTFKKTLTWNTQGFLTEVSPWTEVY